MTGAAAFAALHRGSSPFLLPNAWDVASALLLARAGFPAIGTTSLGVTAAVPLPLNVLWRPGVPAEELAHAGVARVSTGSALYRHALTAALAVATAARDGVAPAPVPVDYAELQHLLSGPTAPGPVSRSGSSRP